MQYELSHEGQKRRLQGEVTALGIERNGQYHQASFADALFEYSGQSVVEARQHVDRAGDVHARIAQKAHGAQSVGHFAKWREQRVLDAHVTQGASTVGQSVGQSVHAHRQQRQVVAALCGQARTGGDNHTTALGDVVLQRRRRRGRGQHVPKQHEAGAGQRFTGHGRRGQAVDLNGRSCADRQCALEKQRFAGGAFRGRHECHAHRVVARHHGVQRVVGYQRIGFQRHLQRDRIIGGGHRRKRDHGFTVGLQRHITGGGVATVHGKASLHQASRRQLVRLHPRLHGQQRPRAVTHATRFDHTHGTVGAHGSAYRNAAQPHAGRQIDAGNAGRASPLQVGNHDDLGRCKRCVEQHLPGRAQRRRQACAASQRLERGERRNRLRLVVAQALQHFGGVVVGYHPNAITGAQCVHDRPRGIKGTWPHAFVTHTEGAVDHQHDSAPTRVTARGGAIGEHWAREGQHQRGHRQGAQQQQGPVGNALPLRRADG